MMPMGMMPISICTMQTVSMKRIGQVGVKEVCTVVLQAVRHGFEAKALIPVLLKTPSIT